MFPLLLTQEHHDLALIKCWVNELNDMWMTGKWKQKLSVMGLVTDQEVIRTIPETAGKVHWDNYLILCDLASKPHP